MFRASAHLAICVVGAQNAGSRARSAVSVGAKAVGRSRGTGVGGLIQRTHVADPGPAPGARLADLALGVRRSFISSVAVACRGTRALHRRQGVGCAVGERFSTRAVGVLWTLSTTARSIEPGIADAVGRRVRHVRGSGVGRTQSDQTARTKHPRISRRAGGASSSLVARQAHTLRDADSADG